MHRDHGNRTWVNTYKDWQTNGQNKILFLKHILANVLFFDEQFLTSPWNTSLEPFKNSLRFPNYQLIYFKWKSTWFGQHDHFCSSNLLCNRGLTQRQGTSMASVRRRNRSPGCWESITSPGSYMPPFRARIWLRKTFHLQRHRSNRTGIPSPLLENVNSGT